MSSDKKQNGIISTSIIPLDLTGNNASLNAAVELGKVFAMSGMWSDVRDAAKATVKIIMGRELGLTPAQAINGTYMIDGKIIISATMLGALIKRSDRYDYRVVEKTDRVCRIAFFENGQKLGEEVFTIEDAKRAGLINKQNWRRYPRAMLFSRALSAGARTYCPDILAGMPVYVPDEAQDIDPTAKPTIEDVPIDHVIDHDIDQAEDEEITYTVMPEPTQEKTEKPLDETKKEDLIDDENDKKDNSDIKLRKVDLPDPPEDLKHKIVEIVEKINKNEDLSQLYYDLYYWDDKNKKEWELDQPSVPQMQKVYKLTQDLTTVKDRKLQKLFLSYLMDMEITTLKTFKKGQISKMIELLGALL